MLCLIYALFVKYNVDSELICEYESVISAWRGRRICETFILDDMSHPASIQDCLRFAPTCDICMLGMLEAHKKRGSCRQRDKVRGLN